MPIQVQTDLPAASIDSLDNGIEDEITAHWTDVINYGSYELRYKESSASSWTVWGTVSESSTSATITNLEDGEEYDFGLRTTTEHVTTDWSATATITTDFPSPTNPTAALSSTNPLTEVDLTVEDHADNEDGLIMERQRQYDYGWGPWQEVTDLGANAGTGTVSTVDDTVSPGNTYRYRFRAYTEDAENTSGTTSTVETNSSDRPRTQAGSQGWYVEIDHPAADAPLTPRVLSDGARREPAVNSLPEVRIPVPRDEKWQEDAFDNAPMRVWYDGRRQPIDELYRVEMREDRTVLVGRGGTELLQRVQTGYQSQQIHTEVENLLTTHTSYTADVDDSATNPRQNVELQDADAAVEFEENLASAFADDHPLEVRSDGSVDMLQTCFFRDVDEHSSKYINKNIREQSSDRWSDGEVYELNAVGHSVKWQFTNEHRIPAADAFAAVRIQVPETGHHEFEITLDGEVLETVPRDSLNGNETEPDWWQAGGNPSSDLQPGQHTFGIELTYASAEGTVPLYVDCGAGEDARWSHDLGQNTVTDNVIDGPAEYPTYLDVEFVDALTFFTISGGRVVVAMDDVSGNQQLALSTDQGSTWTTAANTDVFETDAISDSTRLRARVRLSRYGSRTDESPGNGFRGQSLDSISLQGDLVDIPRVINQSYDATFLDVLQDFAERGRSVFEVRYGQDDGYRVVWTQPGARTASRSPSVASYSVEKDASVTGQQAVVYGASKQVRSESFTASHGTWVALAHDNLVEPKETVFDPDASGEPEYDEGSDYEVDYRNGRIKTLSNGEISDGQTLAVSYDYKTRGAFTVSDVSDPEAIPTQTIPALTNDQTCEQAAFYLVQELRRPRVSAEITVPRSEVDWSLVTALDLDGVPTAGRRLQVDAVEHSPQDAVVRFEGETVGDVLSEIQAQLGSVSDRV